MKKLLLFIALLIPVLAFGQGWKNSNILPGTEDIFLLSSTKDADNNTILFGYFSGSLTPKDYPQVDSRGGRDFFLAKYDSLSNLVWLKGLGSASNEFFDGAAAVDADNNIYVTGGFQSDLYYTDTDFITSKGFHDIFLAKYDTEGNNDWCLNIGSGVSFQRSTALSIDNQSNILLGGYYNDSININGDTTLFANQFKDYFYAKFNSLNGDLVWAKALKSINSNYSGFIYAISPADDHYIVSGVFADSVDISTDTLVSSTVSYYDTHIFKTDLEGDIDWTRVIKGVIWDYSYTSTIDPDNNIYITGYTNSPELIFDSTATDSLVLSESYGDYDFFIAKYETDGTLQWARRNGGIGEDRLIQSNFFEGRLWVTGYFVDNMSWGTQLLTTLGGASDMDAFYGSIDSVGNYTGATQFKGRNNSIEQGQGVFSDTSSLYSVFRSNSDLIVVGDSSYLNPGQNFVIIVGAVGCLAIEVEEDLSKHIDIEGCFGDSTGQLGIIANGGFGGFTYTIGEDYPPQASPVFPGIPAGNYQLEVYDVQGCQGIGPVVTIDQPDELIVNSVDSTDILCFGESTGTISVDAIGGTGTRTYSINGGTTYPYIAGTDVANVAAGTYEIAVKDENNCVKMPGTATILEPESALTIALVSTTDVTCNGGTTGAIEVSAEGGTAPYEYSIDGSEATLESLPAGTYTPMVTDDNGCETLMEPPVTINEPDPLAITIDSIKPKQGDDLGLIFATASGETGDYTYSIDPSVGNQNEPGKFTNLDKGFYTVTVTDDNCLSTDSKSSIEVVGFLNLEYLNASIYPNPSSGMVTVEFTTEKVEMTMEVFSIDGRNVMHRQVYSSGGQVRETLDLSGLDKGMYMIRVDQQTLSNAVVLN